MLAFAKTIHDAIAGCDWCQDELTNGLTAPLSMTTAFVAGYRRKQTLRTPGPATLKKLSQAFCGIVIVSSVFSRKAMCLMPMKQCVMMLVMLAMAGGMAVVQAAPGAGAKASGQFNFYGSSSRNALTSARAQTSTFRQYAEGMASATAGGQGGGQASPIVAKEASDSIGHAVAKSEAYVAAARKQAQGDASAVAALDAIAGHLAEVKKCCAELAECCETDQPDAKRSAECCRELEASLAKAITAHDRLGLPAPMGHSGVPAAAGHHGGTP